PNLHPDVPSFAVFRCFALCPPVGFEEIAIVGDLVPVVVDFLFVPLRCVALVVVTVFVGAVLVATVLVGAVFVGAVLVGAVLVATVLVGAVLVGAVLVRAAAFAYLHINAAVERVSGVSNVPASQNCVLSGRQIAECVSHDLVWLSALVVVLVV